MFVCVLSVCHSLLSSALLFIRQRAEESAEGLAVNGMNNDDLPDCQSVEQRQMRLMTGCGPSLNMNANTAGVLFFR